MIGDNLRESVAGASSFSATRTRPSTCGPPRHQRDRLQQRLQLREGLLPQGGGKTLPSDPVAGPLAHQGRRERLRRRRRTRLFLRDNRLRVFNAATEGLRARLGVDIRWNKDYRKKEGLPLSALAELIYEIQERDGPTLGGGCSSSPVWTRSTWTTPTGRTTLKT